MLLQMDAVSISGFKTTAGTIELVIREDVTSEIYDPQLVEEESTRATIRACSS